MASVKVGKKVAKKVEAEVEAKKEKKEKPVFDLSTAIDDNGNPIALAEERLTALPANVPEGTKGLKRNSFSTKLLYVQWQRRLLVDQRQRVTDRIVAKDEEIEDLKKGGDPQVKKLRRAKKLKAQMDALKKTLLEEGVDVESLGL